MTVVLWLGAVAAMMGWITLAWRIYSARKARVRRDVQLGAHCAMTVIGVVLMVAAYYIRAAQ